MGEDISNRSRFVPLHDSAGSVCVLHWFIQSDLPGFPARLVIEIHDDVIQRVLVRFAAFVGPEAHAQDADLVILED
jgi:hypothetical protein